MIEGQESMDEVNMYASRWSSQRLFVLLVDLVLLLENILDLSSREESVDDSLT